MRSSGAGLLAHVPTIMLPPETRLELNEGKEISPGPRRCTSCARRSSRPLDYDTVVVLDSHWFTTVEFVVDGAGPAGRPVHGRGAAARHVPHPLRLARRPRARPTRWPTPARPTAPGSPRSTTRTCRCTTRRSISGSSSGEGLDKRWISVSVAQTGDTEDFLRAGRALGDAIAAHRPQGPAPRVRRAVAHLLEAARAARPRGQRPVAHPHARGLRRRPGAASPGSRTASTPGCSTRWASSCATGPEAMFAHYLMMIGALGEGDCRAAARQYGDYENSIGTGQVHLWFDRPEDGFPGPAAYARGRRLRPPERRPRPDRADRQRRHRDRVPPHPARRGRRPGRTRRRRPRGRRRAGGRRRRRRAPAPDRAERRSSRSTSTTRAGPRSS